jgi:hypothetical protein
VAGGRGRRAGGGQQAAGGGRRVADEVAWPMQAAPKMTYKPIQQPVYSQFTASRPRMSFIVFLFCFWLWCYRPHIAMPHGIYIYIYMCVCVCAGVGGCGGGRELASYAGSRSESLFGPLSAVLTEQAAA